MALQYSLCVYQQIQLYRQWLRVVVQAVGVRRAAVRPIVIHHDGTGITAVQPTGFWLALLNVALPLLVEHALSMDSVPVEHSYNHNSHHQQGQQALQNHRHQRIILSRILNWKRKMKQDK